MAMLAAAAFPAGTLGQEAPAAAASPFMVVSFTLEPDDPAYTLYREGYGAVLGEQWKAARKSFAELQRRYPGSQYADDAAYWTAYSWKEQDPARAATLYRKLLRDFPQSPYLDDAVADLRMLEVGQELARIQEFRAAPVPGQEIRIGFSQELGRLREDLARLRESQGEIEEHRLMLFGHGDTIIIRSVPPQRIRITPQPLDPQARMRLQAMQELAQSGGTNDAPRALKAMVLDPRQPPQLRLSAVYSLGSLRQPEARSALLEIARTDAAPDFQRSAIEVFAQSAPERGKAVEELIALFRQFSGTGNARDPRLGTTLYAIASIGDARATDFLAEVARTNPDNDIRNSAVMYLGSMGTERARAALIQLLREE
jgi:hypothetical protein